VYKELGESGPVRERSTLIDFGWGGDAEGKGRKDARRRINHRDTEDTEEGHRVFGAAKI